MTTWVPNTFLSRGRLQGYDEAKLRELVAEGRRLQGLGLPVIFSLGHLAAILDTTAVKLRRIVDRKSDPYRAFQMRKRSGGFRVIAIPDGNLIRIQRWIHQQILIQQKCHPASTAYSMGCAPYENSKVHCGARWLVKVDISNFFESVSERQVYYVFERLGFSKQLAFELARLTTRVSGSDKKYFSNRWRKVKFEKIHGWVPLASRIGHLPQGAPTSPMLANLVCRNMDAMLAELARMFNCTYTRYADDLTFSTMDFDRTRAKQLVFEVSGVLSKFGFSKNSKKTKIIPPRARKIVTGLQVHGDAPSLLKIYRDRIRQHLYYANKFGVAEHCKRRGFSSIIGFKNHLLGLIKYASSVDENFGQKCLGEFNKIGWPPN